MKLFITRFDVKTGDYDAVILGDNDKEAKMIILDLFVGCALHIPDHYDAPEYFAVKESIVGTILDIDLDCLHYYADNTYIVHERALR